MAEEFEEEEKELDPKEVKKAEKERKKQEKAAKKAEKKKNKEENSKDEDDDAPEGLGSKILIFFVTLILIVIWLAIIGLLIKWDVGGFGSTVLYPILKDVPYVNMILPEVENPNAEDEYGFDSMDDAIARIKELEQELANYQSSAGDSEETVQKLQDEVARLQVYEQEQAEFEKIRTKFYEEVVFGDEAPDIEQYKSYYETIEPANAAELYKQVINQIQEDEELEDYIKAYSEMKPKAAAKIMEEMTDNLKLVAKILKGMKADARGAIMAAMDPAVAASVTKLMEP